MNETLPQSPPDAPMPPPSEAAIRSQRWRNWIVGVGTVSVIFVGFGLTAPMVIRSRKKADLTEAISNARQIGFALSEFASAYGRFPDDTTIEEVEENHPGTGIPMGNSSANDYFRQLFANDGSISEVMFFGKRTASLKPDNISAGNHALAKRECYFSYIPGHSPMGSAPETPIVVFPLVSGKFIFDYAQCKTFHNGMAVILRADYTVTTLPVDKSGHVFINGKDLFDPSQPFWGGKAPVVKWPE